MTYVFMAISWPSATREPGRQADLYRRMAEMAVVSQARIGDDCHEIGGGLRTRSRQLSGRAGGGGWHSRGYASGR